MRSSHVARSSKALSVFFTLTLILGLMPAAAFAEPVGDAAAPQSSESAASAHAISSEASEAGEVEKSHPSSEDEGHAQVGEDPNSTALPAGDMINQDMEFDTVVAQAESTVIGSFEHRGITYAVEPGGESVAVVAADYAKMPQDFLDAQTIVLPSVVSPDSIDHISALAAMDADIKRVSKIIWTIDATGWES